jgi:glucan phosphoethanolaminetransferase (alkaline phosphatase superfamily)
VVTIGLRQPLLETQGWEAKETMSLQLLLMVAAIGVLPVVGKLIKAIVALVVRLVATAFTVLFVVLVLAAFVSHGKMI